MQSYILIKGPVGLIVRRERESTRSQGWASGVAGLGGRGGDATRSQGWASGVAGLGGRMQRSAGRMQEGCDKSYD